MGTKTKKRSQCVEWKYAWFHRSYSNSGIISFAEVNLCEFLNTHDIKEFRVLTASDDHITIIYTENN